MDKGLPVFSELPLDGPEGLDGDNFVDCWLVGLPVRRLLPLVLL
jgi:hypothetical protein